jgi:hypothetical protein
MQQLDAFAPLTDTPRARFSDPVTSHLAAERIKATGQLRESQILVRDAIRRWPGKTAVELGALMAGTVCKGRPRDDRWWRYEVSRRAPEIAPVHVRRGKPRECTVAGTCQSTWYPK